MKSLKLVAFFLAIVAGFAFTTVEDDPDPNLKIFRQDGSSWVEVEGDYTCIGTTNTCIAQFEDDDPSKQMVYSEPGLFSE